MTDSLEHDIAVSGKSKRILSFDIIRGWLMLAILVGHIELPPNFYDFFTGRGRLFVSPAEGFFFLSGLLVGMIYRRKLAMGTKFVFRKMWTRAAELWVGSVSLTLIYAYIVARTNHFYIKQGLPNTVDWHHIINQTLLLRFEYGWADFLGRFAILMLIAPFVFYLISKGRWRLVLVGIIAAWVFRGQNFTMGWQIIFNGGMLVGYYWNELNAKWRSLKPASKRLVRRGVVTLSAVTFAFSYGTVYILSELNEYLGRLPHWLQTTTLSWNRYTYDVWIYAQKWTMGPLRVGLFFLWGSVLYMWVARHEKAINRRTKGVLLVIGQNSLFVYIFHSVIVFIFKFFIPVKTNALQNFGITTLALGILVGGTYLYRYLGTAWPKTSGYSAWRALRDRAQISAR